MKISQVLYLSSLVKDVGSENRKVLKAMIEGGGLFDQDYSLYFHERLDDVYDLLNDMRVEGVEDAKYWMEKILQYQHKNRSKLSKLAV